MKHCYAGLLALMLTLTSLALAQELTPIDTIQQLASKGDRKTALTKLDERIAANANDVQARFLKGLLLLDQGDTREARELFSDITRQFPRIPEASNNLAAIYAKEGDYEQARQVLLSAIANNPDYLNARVSLGDLYAKLAADAYHEALRLNPNDAVAKAKLKLLDQLFASGR